MNRGEHGTVTGRAARLSAIAAAVIAAVLASIAVGGVTATSAAWTDQTYASATVSAGTWPALGSCTAMTAASVPVGTCTITAMTYDAWGPKNKHLRNVYLTFQVSAPASTSYIAVQADLSAATVGTDTSDGPWSWATAVTLPSSQFTPTSTCAALPLVTGRTVAGWNWADSPRVFFSLADSSSAYQGQPSCR